MKILVIGNAVTLIGAVLMVLIGLIKEKKKILIVQCFQFGIMGLGNLILGGMTGFITNTLSIFRNLICLKTEFKLWMKLVFIGIQMALTVWGNNLGLIGWLPVVAAVIFTFALDTKKEVVLKSAIIAGQICWLIYDLTIKNYVSVTFDIFTILSNIVGIAMLYKRKEPENA